MPEWLMGADCKSAGFAYAGSNPARPNNRLPVKIEKNSLIFEFLRTFLKVRKKIE